MKALLYFDGGTGPTNPGNSACAAVVKLNNGTTHIFGEAIGRQTNNVAEWEGLLLGMRQALALGATDLEVYGDSNLVINQASKRWATKADSMKALAARCYELASQFNKVSYTWIPRALNHEADAKCNAVIREHYQQEPFDSSRFKVKGSDKEPSIISTTDEVIKPSKKRTKALKKSGQEIVEDLTRQLLEQQRRIDQLEANIKELQEGFHRHGS